MECNVCGDKLAASLLGGNLLSQYVVTRAAEVDLVDLEEREGHTFVVHWLANRKNLFCPVPGCVEMAASTWNLRHHFNDRHLLDLVNMPSEGIYPRCGLCGLQSNPLCQRHEQSVYYCEGSKWRVQWNRCVHSALVIRYQFNIDGDMLE